MLKELIKASGSLSRHNGVYSNLEADINTWDYFNPNDIKKIKQYANTLKNEYIKMRSQADARFNEIDERVEYLQHHIDLMLNNYGEYSSNVRDAYEVILYNILELKEEYDLTDNSWAKDSAKKINRLCDKIEALIQKGN